MDETPFARLAGLDRLIHDPSRLAILSALLGCADADFRYLTTVTGLTKGNLSSHLSKLEQAGLIDIAKGFEGKTPWTRIALTAEGRDRVAAHWASLDQLRTEAGRARRLTAR